MELSISSSKALYTGSKNYTGSLPAGARVILACRDEHRGTAAAEEVRERTGSSNVVVSLLDLGSLASIRQFARHVKDTEQRLDILINNAGEYY